MLFQYLQGLQRFSYPHKLMKSQIYLRYLLEKIPLHLKADGTLDDRTFLKELTPWSDVYRSFEMMEKQRGLNACRKMFPVPEEPRTPRKKKLA